MGGFADAMIGKLSEAELDCSSGWAMRPIPISMPGCPVAARCRRKYDVELMRSLRDFHQSGGT